MEDETPQAPQRMTRTTAKTNLKEGVEINDSDSSSNNKAAGLTKSVSAATLRSQTTANLRALAGSTKALTTTTLIAEAKKGKSKF